MFKLPELTYDLEAMAPWVSTSTMDAHHNHHHQTYVDKLNAAAEQLPAEVREQYFGGDKASNAVDFLRPFLDYVVSGQLDAQLDAKLRTTLRNMGGGHFNHTLFWLFLTPKSEGEPNGALAQKLVEKFGSFQQFTEEFETAATGLFGSGWAWLTTDANTDDIAIETTPNQDGPSSRVLLGLDVWEHAYYLDYKWNRADYVKAWWEHVDWSRAAAKFDENAQLR
jgi:Fe-Mn family superoxide dismutase